MENKKEIQLQFRLQDVRLLQFVNLSNGWPEGELQRRQSVGVQYF